MREIQVERDFEKPDEWNVFEGGVQWLAAFHRKEDADEWAEQKRLEP